MRLRPHKNTTKTIPAEFVRLCPATVSTTPLAVFWGLHWLVHQLAACYETPTSEFVGTLQQLRRSNNDRRSQIIPSSSSSSSSSSPSESSSPSIRSKKKSFATTFHKHTEITLSESLRKLLNGLQLSLHICIALRIALLTGHLGQILQNDVLNAGTSGCRGRWSR